MRIIVVILCVLLGLLDPFFLIIGLLLCLDRVRELLSSRPPPLQDDPWPDRKHCPSCGHTGIHVRPRMKVVRNPFVPGFGGQVRWLDCRCIRCECEWGEWDPADD